MVALTIYANAPHGTTYKKKARTVYTMTVCVFLLFMKPYHHSSVSGTPAGTTPHSNMVILPRTGFAAGNASTDAQSITLSSSKRTEHTTQANTLHPPEKAHRRERFHQQHNGLWRQ